MFNLESSIGEWREQMLAAGITPTDADELEGHLRDEIKRKMDSGQPDFAAFEFAMLNLGRPQRLSAEFKRADGFFTRLLGPSESRIERILALGWLVYCGGSLYHAVIGLGTIGPTFSSGHSTWLVLFGTLLFGAIYACSAVSSVRVLFNHARRQSELRILWLLAIFEVTGAVCVFSEKLHPHAPFYVFTILGIISIWLLRPAGKPKAV
jgi:hypothetical protein